MFRVISAVAAAAMLAVAATASAGTGVSGADKANAARACTNLRTASSSAFSAQYANFGACTSKWAHAAHTARLATQTACRQRGLSGNKLAACVKTGTYTTLTPQVTAAKNAAKACAAERTSLGDTGFEQKYGANHNLANAFGKCVSGKSSSSNHGGGTTTGTTTTTPTTTNPQSAQHYSVTLSQLNSSNVSGSGTLLLNANKLQVKLTTSGLESGQTHQIAIRGLSSGSASCPTTSADTNSDGVISQTEGQSSFGTVLLGLDPASLTADGWTATIESSLLPLQTRTIVVLGKTVNGSYDATVPVACGTISVK